jgi:hypothetical protein
MRMLGARHGAAFDTRLNHANLKKTLRTRGVIEYSSDIFHLLSEKPHGAAGEK